MIDDGDPIEPERIRAEVRFRLFGGVAPTLRIGRFELGKRLGAGGMGVVYEARDPDLDRTVAIKVLLDRSELTREAQALAKLRHANVVAVHELGTWQGLPFVAMEHVNGPTLRAWLAEPRRSWREIASVFAGAARGLAAAHAAGLVHRDFKLDNVLVDDDGHARVVDFGLARPELGADSLARKPRAALGDDARSLARKIAGTTVGTRAGTPAYMAPEVLRGEPATQRADQYAFGVALYEALTGARPFVAPDVERLLAAIVERRPAPVPGVPRRIARAIDRCLAVDPRERHPDLAPVIAALDGGTSPRTQLALAGAGVVLAGGAVAIWLAAGSREASPPPPDPCATAGAPIAAVWNTERANAMRAAFAKTHLPFAAASADRATAMLEAYKQTWAGAATEVCRAGLAHSLPESTIAQRTACLDERRSAAAALVGRLAEQDAEIVERAVRATAALPAIESCIAIADLAPLPQDPVVAEKVAKLRERLAAVAVAYELGRAPEALRDARAIAHDAEPLAFPAVVAEAELMLGTAALGASELPDAEAALLRAYRGGLESRHDRVAATAALRLAHLLGYVRERTDDGRRWIADATALVRRLGDDLELTATLHNITGNVEQSAGRFDDAIAAFARAEQTWREARGDHRIAIGGAIQNAGNAMAFQGKQEAALVKLREATAMWTAVVGPDHPLVAMATTNTCVLLRGLGRNAEALALDERTLAAETARLGPEHPDVAFVLGSIGHDLRGLGRYDESIKKFEAARAIFVAKLGPEHPQVASCDNNIAGALLALGRYDEAERRFEAALAVKEKRGATHPSLMTTLDNLGTIALRRGRAAAARAWFTRSLAIAETAYGKTSPKLAGPLVGLAEADLLAANPRGARTLLERALAATTDAGDITAINFALGRARWELGERAAGRELVVAAAAAFTGPTNTYDRDRATAWLAAHPAR